MAKLVHALHEHTSHGASNRSSTSTNGKYSGGENIKQAHMAEGGGGLREAGARNTDPGRCLGTPEPAAIPARSDLARGCADRLAGVERRCRWRAASSLAAHTSLPPFSQSPLCCCAGDDLAWAGLALDLIGFPSTTAHSPLSPLRTPRRPFCCRGLFPLESRLAQLLAASKH
jgi:hypothetical protein